MEEGIRYLLAEISNGLLDGDHVHGLDVADNGRHKTLLGGDGHGNVDVVPVDDGIAAVRALDGGVDDGDVAHGQDTGAGEGAHEAELDTRLLQHVVLVELAELHQGRHVNLVEGGERGSRVLGLLEALGNAETHAVHLDLYKIAAVSCGT